VNFANISMSHSLAAHPAWWRLLKCCFFVGLLLFARRLSHVSCSNERMGAVNWRAGGVVGSLPNSYLAIRPSHPPSGLRGKGRPKVQTQTKPIQTEGVKSQHTKR